MLAQSLWMPPAHFLAKFAAVIFARDHIFGCARNVLVDQHSPICSLIHLSPHFTSTPQAGHVLSSTHSALPDLSLHFVTVPRKKRSPHGKQAFSSIRFSEYGALLVAVHVQVFCCGAGMQQSNVCALVGWWWGARKGAAGFESSRTAKSVNSFDSQLLDAQGVQSALPSSVLPSPRSLNK